MNHLVATVDQLCGHLKALRKARGLTQAQLGVLLGVGQVRIAEIEADPGAVSVAQMHKLLAALGVQISLVETGTGWQLSSPTARVGTTQKPASAKPSPRSAATKVAPKKRGSW